MRLEYLKQAWLVLVLALVFGGALATVQTVWGPKIDANRRDFARLKIPGIVLGAMSDEQAAETLGELEITTETLQADGQTYTVYRVARGGALRGWVVKGSGQGYAGKIELLVGLDPAGETITGMDVLVQTETPGLGNRITEAGFRRQFRDRPAAQKLRAAPSPDAPNEIEALSGATISSQAVCDIVNRTVADVKPKLDELRK